MTGATARQRASIAISFGVQAALIAAILAIPGSTRHAQAVRAGSAPVITAAPNPLPAPSPATSAYPMRLTLRVLIDGADNAVELPTSWGGVAPMRVNYIPPGRDARVAILFNYVKPGSPAATNAWFAIAPASAVDHQLPQLGAFQGSMIRLQSTARWWSTGVRWYLFDVPAAELQAGDFPIIVMGAQEGGHQVMYGIAQLHAP
jgi:hypothetical protein